MNRRYRFGLRFAMMYTADDINIVYWQLVGIDKYNYICMLMQLKFVFGDFDVRRRISIFSSKFAEIHVFKFAQQRYRWRKPKSPKTAPRPWRLNKLF